MTGLALLFFLFLSSSVTSQLQIPLPPFLQVNLLDLSSLPDPLLCFPSENIRRTRNINQTRHNILRDDDSETQMR